VSDRSRAGRRPGNSGTREAIERAARRQFAELGYDRTSVRQVALEAGVDPGLVTHFHGTKQQLFVAVADLPFDPPSVLPGLLAGDPGGAGARLARFLVGVLVSEEGRRRVTGLVRAAASEPEAARMVRERVARELLEPLAAQLGADEPALRASLVSAQMVGLVMARHVVAIEPLASLPAERLAEAIAPVLQRYLTEPLEGP
jgi:AcrR family transcriptional regulator